RPLLNAIVAAALALALGSVLAVLIHRRRHEVKAPAGPQWPEPQLQPTVRREPHAQPTWRPEPVRSASQPDPEPSWSARPQPFTLTAPQPALATALQPSGVVPARTPQPQASVAPALRPAVGQSQPPLTRP